MNDQEPKHFSDHFNIDKAKLNELGVFDPILNFDTKVFVEPLLLKDSSSEIIKNSYQNYKKFFADLLLLLQKSEKPDDKCWRTAKKMVNFPEYQYTCIGYSSGNTAGLGSGIEFNDKILQSAKEIVELAEGNPEIFLLLPLLEEGIAGDRISDMVQNIIDEDICQYTQDIMAQLGLKGDFTYTTKNNNSYNLLLNPYSNTSIKLIPRDILLNLPVADNVDSIIEEMTAHNERLRSVINRDIGDIWFETTKSYRKSVLLNEIKKNKEFFIETLKALKEYQFEHYDLEKDSEGLYKWLENSQDFINVELAKETKSCPDSLESLSFAVNAIIHHFRDTVENKEVWRTFWTKFGSEYRHVRTYYSQMLFFTVCNAWLTSQDSNISINLKYNGKNIDLEFTVSGKNILVVHIKHANNTKLVNSYTNILKKYKNLNNMKHYFLIMGFEGSCSKQLKEIRIIENPACKLFEIDVTQRELIKTDSFLELPDFNLNEDDFKLDANFLEFEEISLEDDSHYIKEKRKGGANSHQAYKPLKKKVSEICKVELNNNSYPSALQLSNAVADIVEKNHVGLLKDFYPYKQYKSDGVDWTKPTFYGWCNTVFKKLTKE